MASLCMGEDFSEELTCAVCLDSWKDPVELMPCGHIYCKECITGVKECPTCRDPIQSTRAPNRTLVNMALQIKVRCAKCGWKGSREQSENHVCSSTTKQSVANNSHTSTNNSNNASMNSWMKSGAGPMQGVGGFVPPPLPQQTPPPPQQAPQPQQPAYSYSMDNFPSYPQPSGLYMNGGPQPPNAAGGGAITNNNSRPAFGYQPTAHPASNNTNNYGSNYNYNPGSQAQFQPPKPPQQPSQPPQRGSRRYDIIEPVGSHPWTLYGIGQDEYDQIVSIFIFFDEDDSGSLEKKEVARLARWLNFSRTDSEVDRIFMDMDARGNGSLSIGEFLTWLKYNKPNPQALYGLTQSQYNTIMLQFHMYDADQDGQLHVHEFTRLVMNLGDVKSVEMAEKLFRLIDKDGDGRINIHDFLTFRAGKG